MIERSWKQAPSDEVACRSNGSPPANETWRARTTARNQLYLARGPRAWTGARCGPAALAGFRKASTDHPSSHAGELLRNRTRPLEVKVVGREAGNIDKRFPAE